MSVLGQRAELCPDSGKHSYVTKAGALDAARGMARRKKNKAAVAYRCESCRFWHLTSRLER